MLRKMTEADAPYLISWRNADAALFGSGAPLSAGDHYRWYHDVYLQDPRDHMYIVLHDERPAGTLGVILGKHTEDTEVQRVLLGRKELARTGVMSAALETLLEVYGYFRGYWLRVKADNDPAISFYRKNGFAPSGNDGSYLIMRRG